MIRFLQRFFAPSIKPIIDDDLYSILLDLQQRVENLEDENVELTNALYECENRLEAKIDSIHPVIYNIHQKQL